MKVIAKILSGSHLYGCAVPESDRDSTTIYIPDAREILLGQDSSPDKKGENEDLRFYSLKKYLKMLREGQPNALDLLFAPSEFHLQPSTEEWETILRFRDRFLSRNCVAFVGYCRTQAAKYVLKHDRVQAMDRTVGYFLRAEQQDPRQIISGLPDLAEFVATNPHAELVPVENANGMSIQHLSVCQLLVPLTANVRTARSIYEQKAQQYGRRVRHAQEFGELDWKSMYHAVRVANEALELLTTGKITLPRPEKDLLLAIRQGKVPYLQVSDLIEENLNAVEKAALNSSLPERADLVLAEEIVLDVYQRTVKEWRL